MVKKLPTKKPRKHSLGDEKVSSGVVNIKKKADSTVTVIWGERLEKRDFIKVPRVLLQFGRYGGQAAKGLKAKHIALVLAIASKKFQAKPLRAYWETLSRDLGVSINTVRRWGYELRKAGIIQITQNRSRRHGTGKPGVRNDANTFSLSSLIKHLEDAKNRKDAEKDQKEVEQSESR